MPSANTKTDLPVKLTKHDLFQANWRWLWGSQICWNYERMMSTGYLFTMLPTLKKLYKNDQDLIEMMKMHNQFFNTNAYVGGFIVGMDMAIEEKQGRKAEDTVAGLKAGLMGPFAGVGDTIVGVILPTIFGSIGAYMGLKGNPTGAILWLLVNFAVLILRFFLLPLGYSQGEKLIYATGDKLNRITDAAILLGVTVVDALIPTVISANVPLVFKTGKVVLKAQTVLDQIMPSLVPVALVALCYWLLGKKRMNSTRLIVLVLILGIALGAFGIIGK
ncbi:PTS system mannose/fructose/sorbose family transporter subunit IID [Lacticaseibacillus paracasei]|uniref:PTS system mannose/fructose/sorbose family transporter subunit IID n=1 Tax=Lacticaseibacillus paracasei TaxID=1597 RepID=UPI001376F7F4|nr:PTS system mannose/fructose/sorbose family transporter subunit IID [Lacticaseibacillus paracasei]MCZ2766013.1 PTS system mannose/fructose/sorbose family transporter subunit IID [Lacticaseibacillus paracasei]MCZ2768524.1 PTS system mannose/fructose/sorbose family transporter subunit IID [Lacticaseibacillus paracasei]MCZ2774033.1 PTS system mannose/fructose/sorbose family transporter subunit IID [Lacticaseibacillus paracasei]MCZ2777002.1 PTS system mannose/fructose/sorbose family transporter s